MIDNAILDDWDPSDWGNDIPFSVEQNTCHELALQVEYMNKITLIMKIETILTHVKQMCISYAFQKWCLFSQHIFYGALIINMKALCTELETSLVNEKVHSANLSYELLSKKN